MAKNKTYPHELIGEDIEVVDSKNKSNVKVAGRIVDETKMTIKVEQAGKIKTLLKNAITIKLKRTGKIITGAEISRRPEDRLKG